MYISRPCARGRKQSNEGAGSLLADNKQLGDVWMHARVWRLGFPSPVSLVLLLQLFVLYSVGAPRQSRLEGTGLCLRGFGEEFENRREALPGS